MTVAANETPSAASNEAPNEVSSEASNEASNEVSFRIAKVELDEATIVRRSAEVEHERRVAIHDLERASVFRPRGGRGGPYNLRLAAVENRLELTIVRPNGELEGRIGIALAPFRRVVRDYFLICESYYEAIRTAPPSRVEAMDMSRRAIHDEGAEMLRERLTGKVDTDTDTARRLFTLVCILHLRG